MLDKSRGNNQKNLIHFYLNHIDFDGLKFIRNIFC